MKRKHFILALVAMLWSFSFSANAQVAKVGNTEYATIDEAIAAWGNNSTLTLLADVTLSDVVTLNSTEHHILNLGTYTMTAAEGKNAFVIKACGTGDAERYAITIKADATNPGGINAGKKCVIYYNYADGGISTNDRPIIKIEGGVFTGSTSSWGTAGIYTIGTAARKCATVNISGGTFNCSINGSSKSKLLISGGVFNYSVGSQGDSTALRLIWGGKFKTLGFMTADSNNTKFWFGTSMGNSNVGLYVDEEGYLVVGGPVITELSPKYKAVASNATKWSTYLTYSSAATNGLYYEDADAAIAKHKEANVTVYEHAEAAEELDNNAAVKDFTPELPSDVETFEVEVVGIEAADEVTTKVTFNVEPKAANGAKVSSPSEAITFRLPVPAAWSGKAKVFHEGTLLGKYTINEDNGAKYVVVSSNSFSEFAVEAIASLSGEGTETSPFIIDSYDKLAAFRDEVNGGEKYAGVYFKLASNITLSGEWTAIGNGTRSSTTYSGNAFQGIFDGGNNTISGLTITSTTADDAALGLFGVVDGGTVKNLTLTDVNINVDNSDLAGGAIGMMLGGATAQNITVNGAVVGNDGVGGIVGRLVIDGTIKGCINNASVTSAYGGIGGIVGKAYYEDATNTSTFASVEECINNGTVSAPMYVGGIAGLARANVTDCVNNGAVQGGTQTGGIVGQLIAAGTVSGNENKAKVSGKNHVGGIIGDYSQSSAYTYNNVSIANNINRGELTATEQCAAIMGCNNIDGFTGISATGNISYYNADGLELFGNPEDMVIDDTNKFALPPVAKIGEVEYATLAEAVADANSGATITLLNGEHELPLFSDKELTFKGESKDGVIVNDAPDARTQGWNGSTFHFENLTAKGATANYYGLANGVVAVTYKDCNINGLRFLYAPTVSFEGCAFNAEGVEHSFWTYGASNVTVANSTFTYTDRAVNCYSENGAEHETDITFNGCSFTYAGTATEPAGAVEINSGSVKSIDLAFNECTAPENGEMWFNSQWDSKKGENTVVEVDGVTVWEVPVVAKVGDVEYKSLQKALDAAVAGTGEVTVEILNDVNLTGVTWTPVTVSAPGYPVVTVEGNNNTITGLTDMLFAGTWAGKSGLIIKDLTIENSAIVNDKDDAKGTVGVGAFIGFPQASAVITLDNCHLKNSSVEGGHWTGGLIGYAAGYAGTDGPVFMDLTITNCSVTGSTITGKGSAGGIIGHGSGNAWTNVVIENTTVSGNTVTSTGSSANKAGAVMGTIGAAGQPTTVNGVTKTGGMSVSATVSDNTVTSAGTTITTIYGRQGTATGVLAVAGGSYDNYPIEEGVAYAAPAAGYKIEENTDGTYGVVVDPAYGAVAKIGDDAYFGTLQAALDAATDGQTVILLTDITLTDADMVKIESKYNVMMNVSGKDITLDLNEKTINIDYNGGQYLYAAVFVADGAGLTVTGNGKIDIAENGINVAYMFWKRGTTGHLTINNGTFHMDDSDDSMVYTNGSEIVTVNGGTFTLDAIATRDNDFPCVFSAAGKNTANIIVKGGTYNYDVNHQYWAHEVNVPETLALKDNGDGTWTVVPAVAYTEEKVSSYIREVGYATLDEALAAAEEGERVFIFAGDNTRDLTIDKAITVQGETDENGNSLVNFTGKLNITADGATAKNLNFNNGSSTAGYISAKDVTVDGCQVVGGNGFRYCYTTGTVTFKNSVITGATYGIHFDGKEGGNIVIENCTITGWTSFASTIKKVEMTGTEFEEGNYNYVRFYQEEVVIDGCTFNEKMGVDLAIDGATVTVTNSTVEGGKSVEELFSGADIVNSSITVDDVKLVRIAKVGEEYYQTVTEAINAAADDATIEILAGTIDEYIAPWAGNSKHDTEKSITIQGAADFGTVLTGGMYLGYDDSLCREHNITVKGIHFTGKGLTVACQQNVAIEDNKFTDIEGRAIAVIGKNINSVVKNNVIENTTSVGIELRNTLTATVENNTITGTGHNALQITSQVGSTESTATVQNNTMSEWGTAENASGVLEGRALRMEGIVTATVNGNVMSHTAAPEEFAKVTNSTILDASQNYWNGVSPLAAGMFTGVEGDPAVVLKSYYTDAEKTNLVEFPATGSVARIGSVYFATFADALKTAEANDEITFLTDINESVTISQSVTIDGGDKNYTGTMTINEKLNVTIQNVNFVKGCINDPSGAHGYLTVKGCTFDGVDKSIGYAITVDGCDNVTIEGSTAKNYNYGMLYLKGSANTVNVKDVTVEDVTAAFNVSRSNDGTFENVTLKNVTYGLHVQNYAARTYTLKNWSVEGSQYPIYVQEKSTANVTFAFEGTNEMGVEQLSSSQYAIYKNASMVGTTVYGDLNEAIAAAAANGTVTLLSDLAIESDLNNAAKGLFNIADGAQVTIDLNGKTIDVTDKSAGNFIVFYNYGVLTIKNGTVNLVAENNRGWNAQSTIILNRGGKLTIESGTYTHLGGTDMAFALDNSGNSFGDAYMTIVDGTVESAYIAIRNRMADPALNGNPGNGIAELEIQGGYIKGVKRGVWGQITNASSEFLGSLTVTGGTIEAAVAIQMAEDSHENISVEISGDAIIKGDLAGDYADYNVTGGTFYNEVAEDYLAWGYQLVGDAAPYTVEYTGKVSEFTIVDGELTEFVNEQEVTVGTLTYERTLPLVNTWMPLYVPFAIPMSEDFLANYDIAYFNDVHGYDDDEDNVIDRTTLELIKVTNPNVTLKANYPLLIRAKNEAAKSLVLTLNDAILCKAEEKAVTVNSVSFNYEIKGTYQTHTSLADNQRVVGMTAEGKPAWGKLTSGYSLNPFRLILTITSRDGGDLPFSAISMRVIGEENEDGTTTIYDVEMDGEQTVDYIYDLQGRRVLEPQKGGLYIVNGKKVIF